MKYRFRVYNVSIIFFLFTVLLGAIGVPDNLPRLYAQDGSPQEAWKKQEQFIIEASVSRLFDEVKVLYRKEEYRAAKEKAEKILLIKPGHKGAKKYLEAIEKKFEELVLKRVRKKRELELKKRQHVEKKKKQAEKRLKNLKKEKIDLIYREGKDRYRKKHYDEAKVKFEGVLMLDPDHSGSKRYLHLMTTKAEKAQQQKIREEKRRKGKRHEKEKKDKKVQEKKDAKRKRGRIKLIYEDAKRSYRKGNYEEAKIKFEKVAEIEPAYKDTKKYLRLTAEKTEMTDGEERHKEEDKERWQVIGVAEEEEEEEWQPARVEKKKEKREDVKRKQEQKKREQKKQTKQELKEINSIYKEGKEQYDAVRYEKAKLKFKETLKLNPTHEGAKKYLRLIGAKMAEREFVIEAVPGPGKLTVEECVEIAVENYLPLKTMDKQIELSKHKVLESRRRLFPALSLRLESVEGTEYSEGKKYKGQTYSVEGQQPVFRGGEYWFVLQQAKINLRISEQNKKRIEEDLILSVKKAFYSLIKAEETLKQQEYLLGEVEKIHNSVNKQHEQGVCSELEFLSVQAKYDQIYFQFISANEDLKLAKLILKQAMNLNPKQPIGIEYSLEVEQHELNLESCLDEALKNRAKIKINELTLEYAGAGKKLARSKGLPKIDLLGSYGESGEAFKEDDILFAKQWYVGTQVKIPFGGNTAEYSLTMEESAPILSAYRGTETTIHSYKLNILDDLKYFSGTQQADIEYEEAKNELNKTKKEIIMAVREAFFNYEKSLIQINVTKSKLKFQSKEVEIFRLKRSLADASDSQIIDSLIRFVQEKFSYVQAVTSYYSAIANFNRAMGISDYLRP